MGISELDELQKMRSQIEDVGGRFTEIGRSADGLWPLYKISFGSLDKSKPALGIIGGVHGLEKIGAQVAVEFLKTYVHFLSWNSPYKRQLQDIRVFFIPAVNPSGLYAKTRGNSQGIDLMRNSPTAAEKAAFLVGGHRYAPWLPWYRGESLAAESKALIAGVEEELSEGLTVTLDLHSGFGFEDRMWFPFAKSKEVFPRIEQIGRLESIYRQHYPFHPYIWEPQALTYTTHGDLWDYMYDEFSPRGKVFLPLTLEMGSWMWMKKKPIQFFSKSGYFNPAAGHRMARILRRHQGLFQFLLMSLEHPLFFAAESSLEKEKWIKKYYGK